MLSSTLYSVGILHGAHSPREKGTMQSKVLAHKASTRGNAVPDTAWAGGQKRLGEV
jgi:hypothetical protein